MKFVIYTPNGNIMLVKKFKEFLTLFSLRPDTIEMGLVMFIIKRIKI